MYRNEQEARAGLRVKLNRMLKVPEPLADPEIDIKAVVTEMDFLDMEIAQRERYLQAKRKELRNQIESEHEKQVQLYNEKGWNTQQLFDKRASKVLRIDYVLQQDEDVAKVVSDLRIMAGRHDELSDMKESFIARNRDIVDAERKKRIADQLTELNLID